jgi:hypothetical protein
MVFLLREFLLENLHTLPDLSSSYDPLDHIGLEAIGDFWNLAELVSQAVWNTTGKEPCAVLKQRDNAVSETIIATFLRLNRVFHSS